MNNFVIWTADNPRPVPPERHYDYIASKVKFIAAQFNGSRFYITAADDDSESISVKLAI